MAVEVGCQDHLISSGDQSGEEALPRPSMAIKSIDFVYNLLEGVGCGDGKRVGTQEPARSVDNTELQDTICDTNH